MRALDLSGNRLAALPEGTFAGLALVRVLDLSGNRLAALPEGTLAGLRGLQRLRLRGNALAALPALGGLRELRFLDVGENDLPAAADTLAGLAALQTLHLDGNGWSELPAGLFRGLAQLRLLNLDDNGLAAVPAGAFEGLAGLKTLLLAGNELEALPEDAWAGVAALRWLDLADNAFAALPAARFDGLAGLEHLDLRGNGLAEVDAGAFEGLAELAVLRLAGNDLEMLPAGVFGSLPELRLLDLGDNALAALPERLFEGVEALEELDLRGNPGAPFALVMELSRTDAADAAPSPATLEVRVAAGAPFPMRARLVAAGAVVSDASGVVESVAVGLGESVAGPFAAKLAAGANVGRVALEVDAAAHDDCGFYSPRPCFHGVETAAGPALALFKERPRAVGPEPAGVTLAGVDEYRLPLAPLFAAAAGETMAFAAESDDAALALARVVDGVLVVVPGVDEREGVATITVVAVDSDGLRATLRFQVTVEFMPVHGRFRGWRTALGTMRIDGRDQN